ncbi:TPA: NAD-dependent epimerase/dehydratase family protein [Streptococcus suis]|nr:NAD-dependent epimerase/dehydratase family protein [Streptococcus suis]HEM3721683.1 NAD-dependent epimerase/dehydratase family protein [Streptococcus suis]
MLDSTLEKDCIAFVRENSELLTALTNKTVFVTGATGLIGSHLVYSLVFANRLLQTNIKIVAAVRSKEKAMYKFADCLSEIDFHVSDISQEQSYAGDIDFIIHGASVTASRDFVEKPVDTIFTALNGTKNILELAKVKKVKKVVYLSSLEVYGINESKESISEDDYGYIDFTQVRSSYSEGKRMAECLCVSYASQFQVPVSLARLTQTFGPGVEYQDNRVFAQFARAVIESKPITLHTKGETMRSYCYTKDAVAAIIHILLKGVSGQAYNVANEDTYTSIYDMAILASQLDENNICKVKVDLQDINQLGYNPTVKINLETKKLKELGWNPTVQLEAMFQSLITSMKVNKENH